MLVSMRHPNYLTAVALEVLYVAHKSTVISANTMQVLQLTQDLQNVSVSQIVSPRLYVDILFLWSFWR